jgi:hypothetical protein
MNRRIKATSMVKFGYIMLALNMVCAGGAYYFGDRGRTTMFMLGSCLWIIMILIWGRNVQQGD